MANATFPNWMIQIQKLDVQDGDILWVKVKDHNQLSDVTHAMARASDDIYRVSGKRFVILVTSDDADITVNNTEDFYREVFKKAFPGISDIINTGYVDSNHVPCEFES